MLSRAWQILAWRSLETMNCPSNVGPSIIANTYYRTHVSFQPGGYRTQRTNPGESLPLPAATFLVAKTILRG